MTKRSILLALVILLFVTIGIGFALQQKPANRPPGVLREMWIPFTENSGIALKDIRPMPYLRGKPIAHGALMVKVGNVWQEMYLDSAPEIMPVKP